MSMAKKGDVIYVNRGLYQHYGIYNHDRSVIHFSTDSGAEISTTNAYIRETTLWEFLKGGNLKVDYSIRPLYSPKQIVNRARSLIGSCRTEYNLVFYNCEHFTHWCAAGELKSKQVNKGLAVAGGIGIAVLGSLVFKNIFDSGKSNRT